MRNIHQVADTLNQLLAIDAVATQQLIDHRVPYVEAILCTDADVVIFQENENSSPALGVLGILNGIYFDSTDERIAALYDSDTLKIKEFKVVRL